jgi:hypothetical protein
VQSPTPQRQGARQGRTRQNLSGPAPIVLVVIESSTKTIGATTVEPGARIRHHNSAGAMQFEIYSVCESAHPERWHGVVSFRGRVLIKTETVDDYYKAAKAAENALADRVAEIFGVTPS